MAIFFNDIIDPKFCLERKKLAWEISEEFIYPQWKSWYGCGLTPVFSVHEPITLYGHARSNLSC